MGKKSTSSNRFRNEPSYIDSSLSTVLSSTFHEENLWTMHACATCYRGICKRGLKGPNTPNSIYSKGQSPEKFPTFRLTCGSTTSSVLFRSLAASDRSSATSALVVDALASALHKRGSDTQGEKIGVGGATESSHWNYFFLYTDSTWAVMDLDG